MSKDTRETIKKETNKFMEKVYAKLTKTQVGVISILLTALVLILFLCTYTGRHVITFVAYVGFVALVLYCGYRLFKHTTARAHGVPKPKKEKVVEPDVIEYDEFPDEDGVPFEDEGSEEVTEDTGEAHESEEAAEDEPNPGKEE